MVTDVMEKVSTLDIESRSCILIVRWGKLSASRQVSTAAIQVAADKDRLRMAGQLFRSDEFKRLGRHESKIYQWLRTRAVPTSGLLRTGALRLPLELIDEVDEYLQDAKRFRLGLIDDFLGVYATEYEQARQALGPLFSSVKFPSADYVQSAYYLEWNYVFLGMPDTLPSSIMQAQKERLSQGLEAEAEYMRQALREAFAGMVEQAVANLGTRVVDGEQRNKKLATSLVPKMNDFLDTFTARDLTNDAQTAALVEQARGIMAGVNTDALRSNQDVRARVQTAFAKIGAVIEENTMLAPRQAIRLED
jgi:hypothetical protein